MTLEEIRPFVRYAQEIRPRAANPSALQTVAKDCRLFLCKQGAGSLHLGEEHLRLTPDTLALIPAGTQLAIRTNENIKATSADVGRQYSAEIAQPVTDQSGNVIIPQGSQAMLSIANVSSGTMGVGSNQVALALQSITANGRTYTVQTKQVQQQGNRGIGANKRTAEMTGGGAVLGTLLGALAGGGKGAAIGAVVGGAGGATAQVLTRGNEVSVPAESMLTFRLDQPITLQ
jgi:hypothetical protein